MDRFRASLPSAQQRLDKLRPRIEEAREKLRTLSLDDIAGRSGCSIDPAGNLCLDFMGCEYIIEHEDFKVQQASGKEVSSFVQSIILMYLATADGTPPIDRWISFHDLPNGLFYEPAFRGYSGAELIRDLQGNLEAFRQAAEALHGEPIPIGDAGYAFHVLPRLKLVIAMWAGEEDFPAQARVLFDETAPRYLSTDGLAILGGQLVDRVLKAAQHD
jgi:hypothetical protein